MSSPSCSSPFTLRSWLAAGPYTLVMSSSFFGSPYHAGLLAALLEAGLPPSEVAGSSSGALVASLHAAGLSMEEYLGVLRGFAQSGVLQLARPWEEPGGLFSLRHTTALLREIVREHALPERLEECKVPVSVSTFDLKSLSVRTHRRGDLAAVVMASCAVPGFFCPGRLDGRPQLDGGVADMPGIAGVGKEARVLYHHCTTLPLALTTLGGYASSVTLQLAGLPLLTPFNLEKGEAAFRAAKAATLDALGSELGPQRVTVRARL